MLGVVNVCIIGGDEGGVLVLDWLVIEYVIGWLVLLCCDVCSYYGIGCCFVIVVVVGLVCGFVVVEVLVLVKMLMILGLYGGIMFGVGVGLLWLLVGFIIDVSLLFVLFDSFFLVWLMCYVVFCGVEGVYVIIVSGVYVVVLFDVGLVMV